MARSAIQLLPEDLGPIFQRLAQTHLPELELELHRRLHEEMRREVVSRSPVGTRPKLREGQRVGTGEYRRSHITLIGSLQGSAGSLSALRVGQTSYLATRAPHGGALERGTRKPGRQRSRAGRWYTRILGSSQAPAGVYFAARRRLRAVQTEIAEAVIRDVDQQIERGA